jgi:mRNA degradation ribonuclease J1/J2
MNQTAKCHQIQGCSGLYIDAFRAFKSEIKNVHSSFILTHYHSDHYNGLPRGKKKKTNANANTNADNNVGVKSNCYNGPALIHCTPITAALLREMHGIDSKFIVEHAYGQTWTHECTRNVGGNSNSTTITTTASTKANNPYSTATTTTNKFNNNKHEVAEITFYDANHCPGAAILLIRLVQQNKYHIHTGDMRFDKEKFCQYPLIQKAIQEEQIDLLYLDTTYSKPKHDFIPQNQAIEMISSQVKKLLQHNNAIVECKKRNFFQPKKTITFAQKDNIDKVRRTLVLLSCYSIGKEKVLWHSAVQSNQKVYVNKTKYKMLQCIQQLETDDKLIQSTSSNNESWNIITKCTTNPLESDLHVIQMGTAGSLFPFFKPNFQECALYAHKLNKGYTKVVAFLPTGWANASKYNQQNSIAAKTIQMEEIKEYLLQQQQQQHQHHQPQKERSMKGFNGNNDGIIQVEVRLIPYSEHSSFTELRSCVECFKPRQIIPTVFSNEKDYNDIERRFHDLIDSQRAKMVFIQSMMGNKNHMNGSNHRSRNAISSSSSLKTTITKLAKKRKLVQGTTCTSNRIQIDENEAKSQCKQECHEHQDTIVDDAKLAGLINMGFQSKIASHGLKVKQNNLEDTIDFLLLKS